MNHDYILQIDNNDCIYKEYLNIRTYHKTIRGFDMFVYKNKNNNWVCTDVVTGTCIDNFIFGHKTKKAAFESAIKFYDKYTDDQIRKVRQNVLRMFKNDGII